MAGRLAVAAEGESAGGLEPTEARRIDDDLTTVLGSVGIAILWLGRDSRVRRFTPEAARLMNLVATDVGRPLSDVDSSLHVTDLMATIQEVLERLAPREQTITDATGHWYQLTVRPYVTMEGKIDGTVLTIVDVDAVTKSDALARRSEQALRDMLGAASESIMIARRDGAITFANATAARTFGYAPDELVGLSVDVLVPEALRAAHVADRAAFHADPRARGMGRPRQELHGRRKDGSLFPIEVTLSTMQSEHGPLAAVFVADITERNEQDARIRKYRRNLQEMAFDSAVAEEKQRRQIATGLHDNIGQALALALIHLTAARAKARGAARHDLDEGMRLISQAIADTRSLTFELSPPVLYDLGLPTAVGWLGEQLELHHGLRVSVASDDGIGKLDDERASLVFRAVRELLTNVVKHAKTKAASVEMRGEGEMLTVVVEDRGAGFDPASIAVHAAAESFGLFSVREQIARLGGSLDIDSGSAHGTKVTLRVPVTKQAAQPPQGELR